MAVHFFLIENLGMFLVNLEARNYAQATTDDWITHSKRLSGALVKSYAYSAGADTAGPIRIRVTYEIMHDGKPLVALVKKLKTLNQRYRASLPGWKTKQRSNERRRESRWRDLQNFFSKHGELITCFKFKGDERTTEGNFLFNLQVASTPRHQKLCGEFIQALADAQAPHGLVRGRREADRPIQQRNGWIRRNVQYYKKRGWGPREIVGELQKELRNGTWDERSKLQFNIANSTLCKIAGIKISIPSSTR